MPIQRKGLMKYHVFLLASLGTSNLCRRRTYMWLADELREADYPMCEHQNKCLLFCPTEIGGGCHSAKADRVALLYLYPEISGKKVALAYQ